MRFHSTTSCKTSLNKSVLKSRENWDSIELKVVLTPTYQPCSVLSLLEVEGRGHLTSSTVIRAAIYPSSIVNTMSNQCNISKKYLLWSSI